MIPWWIEIGFCLSPKTLEIDSLQANLDQQSCKPLKWQFTMEQHLDMAEFVVAMIFVCLGLLFHMILLMKGWWLSTRSIRSRTDQVKPAYEHTHTQTCDQCLEMLWEFFLARNLIYLRFPSVSKSSKWTTRCWTWSLWWPGCPIEMGCLRRLVYAVLSMYIFHGRWIYKDVWYERALLCSIWALFEVSWWVNWGWKRCDMTGNTMQYVHALRAVPSEQLGSNETLSEEKEVSSVFACYPAEVCFSRFDVFV